jgi:hypothetical protein
MERSGRAWETAPVSCDVYHIAQRTVEGSSNFGAKTTSLFVQRKLGNSENSTQGKAHLRVRID